MKSKQLQQGLQQLGEEGAIQVFKPLHGGNMLLGAIGQLQFEVAQHRLKGEYSVETRLGGSNFVGARWISADTPEELREFTDRNRFGRCSKETPVSDRAVNLDDPRC